MARSTLTRLALAAGIFIVSLLPAAVGHGATSAVALPSPEGLSALLTSTRNPTRDLIALAERLKLHTTIPINPAVNATPPDYPIGHIDHFYIANDNRAPASFYTLLPARLVLKTAHAYFYVQQGMSVDMAQLARSAAVFESHTYPTDRAAFGPEWTPGVDDDPHITIFNGNLPGGGELGYVYGEDLYPAAVYPYSNQRKMVYINIQLTQPGKDSYDSTLAHEFQHLIRAHLHPADDAWLNEGSSVLAQVLNGHTADGLDAARAEAPDTQLNTFGASNWEPYYGGGYLWMLYLYEHFGGNRALRTEMADSGLSNMALFDDVLAKLGVHETANEMFADWVVANFLDDRSIAGGRYGYSHTSVHAKATSSETLPFNQQGTMHQYAANYVDIANTPGTAFTLHFAGQSTVPLLNTVAPAQGFWWSNRADSVDDTLTLPPLDLRHLRHATLRYQAWYDLEQDYDYAYVEVSADDGKTWYAQRTDHTTTTNPNGTNFGNGYTGSSCTPAFTARHCWIDQQVDLSPFVGKRILVRFEQVTDDEYNGQGLAVAHLQVPEVGFEGDTTPGGWQPAGWVRTGNTLAERWIVQAIVYRAGGVRVVPLPVGADGQGSLRIPAGSSRVVVAVSPVAPLTTVPNTYTLRAAS